MKLTSAVFRFSNFIRFDHIPGNILIGKHRIWPKLTPKYKRVLLRRIDTEINNMSYISQSYIPYETSKILDSELQIERDEDQKAKKIEKIRANKNKIEDKLLADYLSPLRPHKVME